jgi:outer membrane protein assembly factor BamB
MPGAGLLTRLAVAAAAVLVSACAHPGPASVTVEVPAADGDGVSGARSAGVRAPPPARRATWARRLGGPGAQSVEALAVDRSGNVAIVGTFPDIADFGTGLHRVPGALGQGLFVALLDADGHTRWSRAVAGVAEDPRLCVAFDGEGDVIVAGGISGFTVDFGLGLVPQAADQDVLVAKIDPSGQPLWAKRFGGGGGWQTATGLAVDGAGNVLVAGAFAGAPIDFGLGALGSSGRLSVFVVSLDPRGAPRWNWSAGNTAMLTALAADDEGGAVVAGHFFRELDLGSGPLKSAGDRSAFVAALDPRGQLQWSRRLASAGADAVSALALDRRGDVAAVGETRGLLDLGARAPQVRTPGTYAAVLDPGGKRVRWALGMLNWKVSSAVFDGARDLFVSGVTHQTVDFSGGRGGGRTLPASQVTMAAFSPHGVPLWSRNFGESPPDGGVFAAVDPRNDDLILAASVVGDVDVSTGPLPGIDRDVLLVRLSR